MGLQGAKRRDGKSGGREAPYSIRSVERVCDILDLLRESPSGVSMSEIARITGLPKSSAFRYLTVLESRQYVERGSEDGDYKLGLAFLPIQSRHVEVLSQRSRPYLERLRDRFGETINLGVLDGRRVIYVSILESPQAMRLAARPGDRDYIHSTALGKAIAAHLPEDRVRAILEAEGMPRLAPRTITDPEEYLRELRTVSAVGYAVDERENEPEGRCLAVPILGYRLPAAISLSAPQSRFPADRIKEAATEFGSAARRIAEDLADTG